MLIVLAVIAGTALAAENLTCTSSCSAYSVCTSLNATIDKTAFLNNSLLCDADKDKALGNLFSSMSSCALMNASIEVADLLGIEWDGVSVVESIIEDEDFWMPGCNWPNLASAACIYYSLPDNATTCTTNVTAPPVTRKDMFCPGECMLLASGCLNLKKYRHLGDSITDFCNSVTTEKNTTECFKGQVDQTGLVSPDCSANELKSTSLTGPYILAGIALALAVVALIGLALITCKSGSGAGAPNSF